MTVREAAEEWLKGARDGSIRNRTGDRFKPSAIRCYEASLRGPKDKSSGGLLEDFGAMKLSERRPNHVQAYADRMLAGGAQPSTVRNSIVPLRVIFRWKRSRVCHDQPDDWPRPARRPSDARARSFAVEAARLLAALPEADRALWATAMYAGLRRGELMGLRWDDIDLSENVIRVEQSWDPKEKQMVEPKSQAGRRKVPIASALRGYLAEPKLAGPSPTGSCSPWCPASRSTPARSSTGLGANGRPPS